MIRDRYVDVGLRYNPFVIERGSIERDVLFVPRGLAPTEPGARTLVQLIGQKGAGKTTQLRAWQRDQPGPYHYVERGWARYRSMNPPVAGLVYADEVDRMPSALRLRWFLRLARSGATVIVGTHRDLRRPAQRAGLAVRTHHLGPLDVELARAAFGRRFAAARLRDRACPITLDDDDIEAIVERSSGSFRTAELLAHDLVAQRVMDTVGSGSNGQAAGSSH